MWAVTIQRVSHGPDIVIMALPKMAVATTTRVSVILLRSFQW